MADVESVGVGVPGGVVDGVVTYALNLGIERLDLAARPRARVGHAPRDRQRRQRRRARGVGAAVGERRSLAYLNLGTGLAAGIILDGQLWRGARGAAGEIGHISR